MNKTVNSVENREFKNYKSIKKSTDENTSLNFSPFYDFYYSFA